MDDLVGVWRIFYTHLPRVGHNLTIWQSHNLLQVDISTNRNSVLKMIKNDPSPMCRIDWSSFDCRFVIRQCLVITFVAKGMWLYQNSLLTDDLHEISLIAKRQTELYFAIRRNIQFGTKILRFGSSKMLLPWRTDEERVWLAMKKMN